MHFFLLFHSEILLLSSLVDVGFNPNHINPVFLCIDLFTVLNFWFRYSLIYGDYLLELRLAVEHEGVVPFGLG